VGREHANTDQSQERCNKIHDATFVFVGASIGVQLFREFFVDPENCFVGTRPWPRG
jgi:hypothetical protein